MKKLIKYTIGQYDIFRGRHDKETWFVYDTKNEKYTGGSFDSKKEAVKYAEGKS